MLYNKQLGSIEELRAERLALKKNAQKKLQLLEENKKPQDSEEFLATKINALTSGLMGNSKYADIVNTVSQIATPFILKQVAAKSARHLIGKAASELLFGYAKWKAISVVSQLIIKKVKERKKAQ